MADFCGSGLATSTYKGDYEWDWEGMTYKDERGLMQGCASAMLLFWFAQCCCCWCPLSCTPVKDETKIQKPLSDFAKTTELKAIPNVIEVG
jgi:hypothetical protein